MRWLIFSFCVLGLFIVTAQAFSKEPSQLSANLTDQPLSSDESLAQEDPSTSMLTRSRAWLARQINWTANGLDGFLVDTFFGDDILDDEVSGSRLRLGWLVRHEHSESLEQTFSTRLSLDLPNTEEQFKFLLTADGDELSDDDLVLGKTVEKVTYNTALRYHLDPDSRWKSDFDVGVRWRGTPDPFTRLRFRRVFTANEWQSRLTQTFSYFVERGFVERTDLQIDKPLALDRMLRLRADIGYNEEDRFFRFSYDASVYRQLTERTMLAYVVGAHGDNETHTRVEQYYAGVRFRHRLYSHWLYAEVMPQYEWHDEHHYHGRPVLMVRFEALIEADQPNLK